MRMSSSEWLRPNFLLYPITCKIREKNGRHVSADKSSRSYGRTSSICALCDGRSLYGLRGLWSGKNSRQSSETNLPHTSNDLDLVIEASLLQGLVCGTICRQVCDRSLATDSLGDIWKIIYLRFGKSQRIVTHDSLRYINIFTYLITFLLKGRSLQILF